jgi:hypothetical protein
LRETSKKNLYMLSVLGVPDITFVQFALIRLCDWVSEVAELCCSASAQLDGVLCICYKELHPVESSFRNLLVAHDI